MNTTLQEPPWVRLRHHVNMVTARAFFTVGNFIRWRIAAAIEKVGEVVTHGGDLVLESNTRMLEAYQGFCTPVLADSEEGPEPFAFVPFQRAPEPDDAIELAEAELPLCDEGWAYIATGQLRTMRWVGDPNTEYADCEPSDEGAIAFWVLEATESP